jgi:hypothetical protein
MLFSFLYFLGLGLLLVAGFFVDEGFEVVFVFVGLADFAGVTVELAGVLVVVGLSAGFFSSGTITLCGANEICLP